MMALKKLANYSVLWVGLQIEFDIPDIPTHSLRKRTLPLTTHRPACCLCVKAIVQHTGQPVV